ncbi:MAG: HD-GYP domain-containing protein, partial [Desulfobacterales bacterium]
VEILRKSDPLTRTERGVLEHHTVAGYVLLTYYLRGTQRFSAKIARDHHERRDGSGYPRGIALADRMVEIVAVTDVYDALISKRPYRSVAYDNRTALEEITTLAERNQIGWDMVKALVARNRKDKPHYSTILLSAEKRGTPPPRNVYGVIAREDTDPLDTEHLS